VSAPDGGFTAGNPLFSFTASVLFPIALLMWVIGGWPRDYAGLFSGPALICIGLWIISIMREPGGWDSVQQYADEREMPAAWASKLVGLAVAAGAIAFGVVRLAGTLT